MRLLWMKSDYIIPPDTGGKIRTYNLLRELHQLAEVTYLSLKNTIGPNDEPAMRACASKTVTYYRPDERKSGLSFYGRVLSGVTSQLPYTCRKYYSEEIRAYQRVFLRQGANRYGDGKSVILCDFLEMVENVDWSNPCPKVLFQHNVESMIWKRYHQFEINPLKKAYFRYEAKRMRRYETNACNKFDLVLTVSEQDKTVLRDELGVTRPIEVIDTGVDTEFFAPQTDIKPEPGKLVFLGSMDWMPNIDGIRWFVSDIYPQVRAACPHVSLDIVGRRPVPEVRSLASQDRSILVTGDVDDVRPYLAKADLLLVPLRVGGGSRIKIFEAMAMGRPIVSTTVGAEGLPVTDGRDIVLADDPKVFAQQIVCLLNHADEAEGLAQAGHQLVTNNYGWAGIAKQFCRLCEELT